MLCGGLLHRGCAAHRYHSRYSEPLWASLKMGSKIDVQFLEKNTVLFRIENPQMRARVTQRRYWYIADVPLVVNEWTPESALDPPDLSAMPIWIDLKGVPSLMFSHKALKCLSRTVRKFFKLHPNTEKCTRLDVARVLVEVNLNDPLVEKISFQNKEGAQLGVIRGVSCTSKKIHVLQKGKEFVVGSESSEVEINGDGKVRYELAAKRNVVSELLLELERLPPSLGSDVIGDATRKVFEIGGSSNQINGDAVAAESQQEWALLGGKSPTSSAVGKQKGLEQNGEVNVEDDGIISPSRFSVLATKGFEVNDENDDDEKGEDSAEGEEIEEGEDSSKSVRFKAGTSLILSKQIPARSKEAKAARVNTNARKTSSRKL
ncbi:hypothetical protein IGI04_026017 [Brassica rapa subsp. trilocularis]|uniref:DUF4283 domain-containing protein n=1 Tax=Brassica rapa subsp. trilocularis TaxID=1813537 RepID=A0ABQ7KXH9_BRACM|nr:hypothetical protein IGI04_026017 [Brassica rapa subsp. trilocularis]